MMGWDDVRYCFAMAILVQLLILIEVLNEFKKNKLNLILNFKFQRGFTGFELFPVTTYQTDSMEVST